MAGFIEEPSQENDAKVRSCYSDPKYSPAKMKALYSSSDLAVNVFDYWSQHDVAPLAAALALDESILSVAFEAQYPTGLGGNPPNSADE